MPLSQPSAGVTSLPPLESALRSRRCACVRECAFPAAAEPWTAGAETCPPAWGGPWWACRRQYPPGAELVLRLVTGTLAGKCCPCSFASCPQRPGKPARPAVLE